MLRSVSAVLSQARAVNSWQRRLLPLLNTIRRRARTLLMPYSFLLAVTIQMPEAGKAIHVL